VILHNSIRLAQTLCRRNSYAQISSACLAPGQRNPLNQRNYSETRELANPLKSFLPPNMAVGQAVGNSLISLQCVNLHSAQKARNSLNQLDYNESLELTNWLIILLGVAVTSSKHEQYYDSQQNNVIRGLEVPTNNVGSCEDNAVLRHEENQQRPALGHNPDLAYERVVTHSYQVNQLSLRWPGSQPSLRGEDQRLCGSLRPAQNLQVTKSHSQNSPEIIGSVTYETFVGNRITDSHSVPAKKKGRASNPTLWLVGHRQTTGNPAVNSALAVKGGILPLGYSDALAFRRWSSPRATLISCSISSEALTPIFSTCASASREETRRLSPLPSAWRRAISLRTAVIINCARDSPSLRVESISLTTLCGKRALICCDLLFVALVTGIHPLVYCAIQHNTEVNTKKSLQCDSLLNNVNTRFVIYCDSAVETAKPGSAPTLTGPLTTTVIGGNSMAGSQHTQTRPKFQYRFLALSATACNIISIVATTEREARKQSPAGCVMVFAGRLPVQEVRHA
jgi:hypothetical protein